MDWSGAIAAGWRVMEYRPQRLGEDGRNGFVLVDGETQDVIKDPVVDSIGISISADGPVATIRVSLFEPNGFPLTPEALLDRSRIMPYSLFRLGEMTMPIAHVSCVDRITKISATFAHVMTTAEMEGRDVPGVPRHPESEPVIRATKGRWGDPERQTIFRPNRIEAQS